MRDWSSGGEQTYPSVAPYPYRGLPGKHCDNTSKADRPVPERDCLGNPTALVPASGSTKLRAFSLRVVYPTWGKRQSDTRGEGPCTGEQDSGAGQQARGIPSGARLENLRSGRWCGIRPRVGGSWCPPCRAQGLSSLSATSAVNQVCRTASHGTQMLRSAASLVVIHSVGLKSLGIAIKTLEHRRTVGAPAS